MARLDRLAPPVRNWRALRDWWRDNLGFDVEFEISELDPNASGCSCGTKSQ